MKYNSELTDLSRILYKEMDKKDKIVDSDTLAKEQKIIAILMKRFTEQSLADERNDGIIKIAIKDGFWREADEGFAILEELRKTKKLDAILKEYNMYVGTYSYSFNDSYTAYYEIIWDYKAYFESVIVSNIAKGYINDFHDSIIFINSLSVFKTFPEEKQRELLDIFLEYILMYFEQMIGIERNDYQILRRKK